MAAATRLSLSLTLSLSLSCLDGENYSQMRGRGEEGVEQERRQPEEGEREKKEGQVRGRSCDTSLVKLDIGPEKNRKQEVAWPSLAACWEGEAKLTLQLSVHHLSSSINYLVSIYLFINLLFYLSRIYQSIYSQV